MQTVIVRAIGMAGFKVPECARAFNGREALQTLRDAFVNLILTDINMPEMDGEEMIRAIRANPRYQPIPIVVISTDASEGRIQQMLDIGAQDYITKPFTPERLREVLAPFLGRTHA
jgi:two-component system chemotaxis response regulator CheY